MISSIPSSKIDFSALLLEDYLSDAQLIEYYLRESYPNCQIYHVTNEAQYKEFIDQNTPDVILSDYNIPNYSALEAFSEAKKKSSEIPFIIISGYISEEEVKSLILEGIDDYLMKSSLTRIGLAVGNALQSKNSFNALKTSDSIIKDNYNFINNIIEHSGMAICEITIPIASSIFMQKGDVSAQSPRLVNFLSQARIKRVNQKVIELFEFRDSIHFQNEFIKIFEDSDFKAISQIIFETQKSKSTFNKRISLKSFKGHKRHINLNLFSRKEKSVISVVLSFLDETARMESEIRTEKLLERMEKTIFERTRQLKEVNHQLTEQANKTRHINEVLEYNFNQTKESIIAAKKIQKLTLPKISQIKNAFSDAFIFYKAKDIVSGDFYWCLDSNDSVWIAAADCTGHGVPGALMAMSGAHLLSEIMNNKRSSEPNEVLSLLDQRIIDRLKQRDNGNMVSTGMDISLCRYDKKHSTLYFSGAFQDLFIKKNKKIITLKGDRRGIGGTFEYKDKHFSTHKIQLAKGDKVYFTSDGMPDQFGGEKGKKLMKKKFIDILQNFKSKDMNGELLEIKKEFYDWKGREEQVDDIVVMGIEI